MTGRPLGVLFREELQEIGPDVAEAAHFGVLVHPRKPLLDDPTDSCDPSRGLQLALGAHDPGALMGVRFVLPTDRCP